MGHGHRTHGHRQSRLRGFRTGGREEDIARHFPGIDLFTSGNRDALASALRAVRRARHSPFGHYDPTRHAALLRIARTMPAQKKTPPF